MRTYRPPPFQGGFAFGSGPVTPGVKVLLVATAVVFFLQAVLHRLFGLDVENLFGLVPWLVLRRGFLWQPATYLFLHGGLLHLGFNLLVLWMFGGELERVWGKRTFLRYFFLCGIGAAACVILLTPSSPIPTIGASGALYGILLAYGLLFPERQIFLWFLLPIRAKHFVLVLGALTFYSTLTLPGSSVSHVAHLGGLVVGYLYLRGWRHVDQMHQFYLKWKLKRLQKKYRIVDGGRDKDRRPPVQ
jgi:membrane associated rhomboid family serine protease